MKRISISEVVKSISTGDYKDEFDYREAQQFSDKVAYMGNVSLGFLGEAVKDVLSNGSKSPHFGEFFCPDRPDRGVKEDLPGKWTPHKNQAFMAGAIDAHRTFVLTSPIELYAHKIYGTGSEILWLLDNGYTFEPHSKDHPEWTIIKPPAEPRESCVLTQYWIQDESEPGKAPEWKKGHVASRTATFAKMDKLIKEVLDKRETEFGMREFRIHGPSQPRKQEEKFGARSDVGSWRSREPARGPEVRAVKPRSEEWRGRSENRRPSEANWRREEKPPVKVDKSQSSGKPLSYAQTAKTPRVGGDSPLKRPADKENRHTQSGRSSPKKAK